MTRILVVEDDPSVQSMLRQTLVDAGYDVLTANDGSEVIALLKAQSIDLLITDMVMPMSGVELLGSLVKPGLAGGPGFKIIAISGGGDLDPERYLRSAKLLGADRTLAKPILRQVLLQTIDEVLAE
ncbi:MAG: response regulator [Candidatus Krumholzibacteriia bacterium]